MINRIIKFRAWFIEEEFMDCNPDIWDEKINTGIKRMTEGHVHDTGKPIYILMQFTGLLDKSGVEIYEGDIIRWIGGESVVEWNSRTASFRLYPSYLEKTMYSPSGKRHESSLGTSKKFIDNTVYEVIGNTHENPELLEHKS